MPDIWAIMRAIRGSGLPSTDRHILMTLASLGSPETGIIPERFQPSLTDLARFTGLGRSTIARRLPFIEKAGWIKRTAPSLAAAWKDKEKNSYLILVPTELPLDDGGGPVEESTQTSPRAGLVPEGDQSADQSQSGTSPTAGLALVPQRDRTSPTAGLEVPDLRTVRTTTSPKERSGGHNSTQPSEDEPPKKQRRRAKAEEPLRPDVEEVCRHLADAVEANGSKRPTISDKWRTEARLLLDEKRTPMAAPEKVKALIDWIQTNDWWKPRVLAMPKLRAKYDEIRLDALRDFNRNKAKFNEQPRSSERHIPASRITNSHENKERYLESI